MAYSRGTGCVGGKEFTPCAGNRPQVPWEANVGKEETGRHLPVASLSYTKGGMALYPEPSLEYVGSGAAPLGTVDRAGWLRLGSPLGRAGTRLWETW